MKYVILLVAILISLTLLTACIQEEHASQPNESKPALSYNLQRGGGEDTVLQTNVGVENHERLIAFHEAARQKKADNVTIVKITTEGQPINHILSFNGKDFLFTINSSSDPYGSETETSKKFSCEELQIEESTTATNYVLNKCAGSQAAVEVLYIEK